MSPATVFQIHEAYVALTCLGLTCVLIVISTSGWGLRRLATPR